MFRGKPVQFAMIGMEGSLKAISSTALASPSWAGPMSREWKAPATGRATVLLAPLAFANSIAFSTEALFPLITVWSCVFTLEISVSVSRQMSSRAASSIPKMAAMPPSVRSAAYCINRPRSLTRRAASAMFSAPAATRAVYSPRLCPATRVALGIPSCPRTSSIALRQARLTAIMPG